MNTTAPKTLAARPTYTRQISDASSVEMARLHDRAAAQPLSMQAARDSMGLSTDIFARNPSLGSPSLNHDESPRGSTAYAPSILVDEAQPGILGSRNRPRLPRVPSGLRDSMLAVGQAIGAHWRDLTVGGALVALGSWAIWATVRIHQVENIPFCVFEDSHPQ